MAGVSHLQDARGLGVNNVFDDDADTTATKNVDNGSTTLMSVMVDSANAAKVYVILYDDITPTVGTTVPDYQFPVQIGSETVQSESWECLGGVEFKSGLSMCAVTTGGTACEGDPATPIDVRLTTSGGN